MAYDDLLKEIKKKYNVNDVNELQGIQKNRYTYSLTSNDRGIKLIENFELLYDLEFNGKNVLDIGCAYGGFCIEAAKKGASTFGIDVDPELVRLAGINASKMNLEDRIKFLQVDATSNNFLLSFEGIKFDYIFVVDVFEHVYDTVRLVENISKISKKGTILFFKIPNGFCLESIKEERHTIIEGISLMDPSFWSMRLNYKHFDTYYRRWNHFASIFSFYGFDNIKISNEINQQIIEKRELINTLNQKYQKIKNHIYEKSAEYELVFREAIISRLQSFEDELRIDLESLPTFALNWKYCVDYWQGIAIMGEQMRYNIYFNEYFSNNLSIIPIPILDKNDLTVQKQNKLTDKFFAISKNINTIRKDNEKLTIRIESYNNTENYYVQLFDNGFLQSPSKKYYDFARIPVCDKTLLSLDLKSTIPGTILIFFMQYNETTRISSISTTLKSLDIEKKHNILFEIHKNAILFKIAIRFQAEEENKTIEFMIKNIEIDFITQANKR